MGIATRTWERQASGLFGLQVSLCPDELMWATVGLQIIGGNSKSDFDTADSLLGTAVVATNSTSGTWKRRDAAPRAAFQGGRGV